MRAIFLITFGAVALFAVDLQQCVQTTVSPKSSIFSCVHGEYYVEYSSSSKRDVAEFRILYTEKEKYKYLRKKLELEDRR